MTELVVEDVGLRYGQVEVLRGVSFTLGAGETAVLVGSSGSGKTTLLRTIAGFERPSHGRIVLGGEVLFDGARRIDTPAERRPLGVVFQSYALWPHRSVSDTVAYGLRLRRVARAEVTRRVGEVLEALGLGAFGARFPHELSGGQQQRVAIARALVYQPRLLLMDEPLSNLDAQMREDAKVWLKQAILAAGTTVIMVTHDQAEAMAFADRVVLLAGGRIEQNGDPFKLYNEPATLTAAGFFGRNNRLAGKLVNTPTGPAIAFGGFCLPGALHAPDALAGSPCAGVIRIERCRLLPDGTPGHPSCQVTAAMYLGTGWEVIVSLGDQQMRVVTETRPAPGPYALALPPGALWLFAAPQHPS